MTVSLGLKEITVFFFCLLFWYCDDRKSSGGDLSRVGEVVSKGQLTFPLVTSNVITHGWYRTTASGFLANILVEHGDKK